MPPLPNPHTSDILATNLLSTATHQYAAWYTVAGELKIGRRNRATQTWGVNHEEHLISGAARTALALPVADDDHNFPSIAVGTTGHIYVWANMHINELRMIRSVNPNDISSWQTATLPNPSGWVRWTYPMPTQLPDGSVMLYIRAGDISTYSGRSDSQLYLLDPGETTWRGPVAFFEGRPAGSHATADDLTNWSGYPTPPFVDSEGRIHVSWCWRQFGADGRTNVLPSYAYSDDNGATWRAVDDTLLTLPISPLNNPACQTGLTATGGVGYLNWGGICVDGERRPQIVASAQPWFHIRWTGSSWEQSSIGSSLNGHSLANRMVCYWLRGRLWILTPSSTGTRHMRLFRRDGAGSARMSYEVPGGGLWESNADPEAYRRWGVVEVLHPDGDTPRISQFGANARRALV